ncbi:unnamed protein product [Lymnaea stagnalis]|uniref:Spindle assembly abnormal protein 6 N-terminal domain-containing protein n=1 Tax=Lymnaea stagnalis TaxID=6523 RepID=A0AAV2HBE3_LYMST
MEDIFSKHVPLLFKASDREERKVYVQLHMKMQCNKHDSKKELVVKLTDDQDLFFLYTLRLAEEDFQSLKMQQGLLVDFVAFPQKFVDLLEMCIKESHKENPKFIIHFVSGGSSMLGGDAPCTMNIVETNPFRHLNHLSLKFLPGSDADIKAHLASCLKQLKETNNLIQHKFEHTSQELSSKLQSTQELLASKSSELESLKLEWSSRIADITSKHKEDMALEKEKTVQFQSSLQVRFDRERRELEQTHMKLVKQLETRLEENETLNKDLTDKKYKSEATIRDYKSRLATLEEDHSRMKAELHTLRKENISLESLRQERDKSNNALQTRVAVLEQELKDKAELLDKSNDLFSSEKDKKKHLETELEARHREINKLETKVKAMGEELKKGNEIIKKLQGDIKTYHGKVKLRTQIATEQEKLLGEKNIELEKLRQDLAATKDKLRDTEDKNQKLSTDLESAKEKLEESRKLLKTNENMIQWLNKQINEQKVNQNHLGHFELPTTAHARPAMPIHNYSTSSHGSAMSQDSLRFQAMQRQPVSVPLASRNPQMDYQSGQTNVKTLMSSIPVPVLTRKNGVATPPNQQENMNSSGGDKDKNPPLDPKFLSKRDEAIPVRGILNQNSRANILSSLPLSSNTSPQNPSAATSAGQPTQTSAPPVSTFNGGRHMDVGSVRLSQQLIIPRQQPPLASAYFPAHS